MAMASGIGAKLDAYSHAGLLFGEDQGRYIIVTDNKRAIDEQFIGGALRFGMRYLGVTGGDALIMYEGDSIPVSELKAAHESWLPDYMAGTDMKG
jgi:phosphoribosylformylglycinamidine synthase